MMLARAESSGRRCKRTPEEVGHRVAVNGGPLPAFVSLV